MIDVVLLLVVVAFFALCVGYVRVCDRIIGPDPALPAEEEGLADAGVSQAAVRVTAVFASQTTDNYVGLAIAVVVLILLVLVLVFPERF